MDTGTDAKIRKSFAEKIPGTTVFIIAQRISSVENADHVIVLDNGRISGYGTPAEMLATNPIYQEVYNSQTKGSGDFDEKEAITMAEQKAKVVKVGRGGPAARAPKSRTPARSSCASCAM